MSDSKAENKAQPPKKDPKKKKEEDDYVFLTFYLTLILSSLKKISH